MKSGDQFLTGEIFRTLLMPEGGMIFTLSLPRPPKDFEAVELINHNVFRVDKKGRVMWQITRIDHPGVNWEAKHRHAREDGLPGCIEPFKYFRQRFPNGTTNLDFGLPPDSMDYIPGLPVELANAGIGSQWFELSVETGVAVEITPQGHRPW